MYAAFSFIENAGDLVCPSSYDLGEELRVVLLSAKEDEDQPMKYSTTLNGADIAAIAEMHLDADMPTACAPALQRAW